MGENIKNESSDKEEREGETQNTNFDELDKNSGMITYSELSGIEKLKYRLKGPRCRKCSGCLKPDCGECKYCKDKVKFGGKNLLKQACAYKVCEAHSPKPNGSLKVKSKMLAEIVRMHLLM